MAALCWAWELSSGLYTLCLTFRKQPEHHCLGRRQPEQVCNPTFGVGDVSRLLIGQRDGAEIFVLRYLSLTVVSAIIFSAPIIYCLLP